MTSTVLRLLPKSATVTGRVLLEGEDVLILSEHDILARIATAPAKKKAASKKK